MSSRKLRPRSNLPLRAWRRRWRRRGRSRLWRRSQAVKDALSRGPPAQYLGITDRGAFLELLMSLLKKEKQLREQLLKKEEQLLLLARKEESAPTSGTFVFSFVELCGLPLPRYKLHTLLSNIPRVHNLHNVTLVLSSHFGYISFFSVFVYLFSPRICASFQRSSEHQYQSLVPPAPVIGTQSMTCQYRSF